MNKIFFRIWDKANKQMISDVHICPEYGWLVMSDNDALSEMMGRVNPNNLVWMQYTGLKDKNGVEIYEGDIVISSYAENQENIVKFDEDRCGYYPFATGDGCGCCETNVFPPYTCEVIGNIYDRGINHG